MKLERICINYMDKCDMNCPYCFNPFINEKPIIEKTKELLDKCKELNIRVISIGGGDPLMYGDIMDVINYAFMLGFEIHIDSNCHFLSKEKLDILESKVSLLGIPVDGSIATVHNLMRGSKNDFDLIMNKLLLLKDYKIPVKINTVVSRINSYDIVNIQDVLLEYRIKIWSLYQYWPLNTTIETQKLYEITDEKYEYICNSLNRLDDGYIIEVNPYKKRYQTSLFTSPNGSLYLHDPTDIKKYSFIGSIFNEDLDYLLLKNNIFTTIRNEVKIRYNTFNY